MQRNNIPLFLMLIAGVITCILTIANGYELHEMLFCLLIALLVFYFLGSLLKWCLNTFEKQNQEAADAAKAAEEAIRAAQAAEQEGNAESKAEKQ